MQKQEPGLFFFNLPSSTSLNIRAGVCREALAWEHTLPTAVLVPTLPGQGTGEASRYPPANNVFKM